MSALTAARSIPHRPVREEWLHALRRSEIAVRINRNTLFGSLQQGFQRRTRLRAEGGRPSVVFLGEFPRWRLSRDENNREIEMRVCVIRIFGDGLEHLFFCLLLPAFLAGGNTEVIVRGGTVRVELDCFSQFLQRLVESRLAIM